MNCPHCNHEINPAALLAKQAKENQTPQRRKEIASLAAKARWAKYRENKNRD